MVGKQQVQIMTTKPPVTNSRKTPPGSVALRPAQIRVLEAIRTVQRRLQVPPARSELVKELGYQGGGSVDGHLLKLSATGWLKVRPGIERGIILLREGVALYEPDQVGENEPEWIDCKQLWTIFGQVPDVCLWIRGDAMNRAGLANGAMVALARRCDGKGKAIVADGDIVAAHIEDDVVVRRVRTIDATTLELRAESTSRRHNTVRFDTRTDDIEIIGVVIGRMLPGAG